jgi:hypothetical protein
LAIGSAALLLGSTGCGGEETASPGGDASSTPQIALPTPKQPSGPVETSSGEVPAGFPDDLLLPPDSKPNESVVVAGQIGMVTFLSPSTPEEVRSHFAESLPGQGWEVSETIQNESRTVIRAQKGGRTAGVIIAPGTRGSGTNIAITIEGS